MEGMRSYSLFRIKRREDLNLLRDRETMMRWMEQKSAEFAAKGDALYEGFKNSVGFFYDSVKQKNISLDKCVGKQSNPWTSYVEERREWLKLERLFLAQEGYVEDLLVLMELLDSIDEVPVTLKGKARKQCNVSDRREVQAIDHPITFDSSKRFATVSPIVSYKKVTGVYVNLRGSPSATERAKYPPELGYDCTKKAWMGKPGWIGTKGLAGYYRRRTRLMRFSSTRRDMKRVGIFDHYGVHTANQKQFEIDSGNHARLFIKAQTHNGQPIDMGIGKFFQDFVARKMYLLQREYSDALDKGFGCPVPENMFGQQRTGFAKVELAVCGWCRRKSR
eukprot:278364_1